MLKTANLVITLLTFLCTIHQSFQCSPGPDYEPPTIANLTQKAPIVVRGFVIKKVGDNNRYTACLFISHVYKGSHFRIKRKICASKFGSTAACLSNPAYGVEYLFFLNKVNKLGTKYEARYDSIHSAAQVFKKDSVNGVRDGKCCPRSKKSTYIYIIYTNFLIIPILNPLKYRKYLILIPLK